MLLLDPSTRRLMRWLGRTDLESQISSMHCSSALELHQPSFVSKKLKIWFTDRVATQTAPRLTLRSFLTMSDRRARHLHFELKRAVYVESSSTQYFIDDVRKTLAEVPRTAHTILHLPYDHFTMLCVWHRYANCFALVASIWSTTDFLYSKARWRQLP